MSTRSEPVVARLRRKRSAAVRLGLVIMAMAGLALTGGIALADDPPLWCGEPIPPPSPAPDPPACPPCNCHRSPCSVATLKYTFSVTDISINAVGVPIQFERTYDTRRFLDGIMGIAWLPKYGTTLRPSRVYYSQPDGRDRRDVFAVWGDLRRTTFAVLYFEHSTQIDRIYVAAGVLAELRWDQDTGTWQARPERARDIFSFDANFKALSLRSLDNNGVATEITFDGNGRLMTITNSLAGGRRLDVGYGADGRVSSVSDPTGRAVLYGYDPDGYLTSVTNPLNQTTTYTYTTTQWRLNRYLEKITDHWGRVVTEIAYRPESSYVRTYKENGETYTYTPLTNSRTSKADSSGRTWIYTYDVDGRVTLEQSPVGTKTIGYDGFGHLAGIISERNIWNAWLYNSNYPYYTLQRHWLDKGGSQEVRFEYLYDPNFPEKVTAITPYKPDDSVDPDWQPWQYDYYQAGDPSPGSLHHVYRVRSDGVTLDTLATYAYNSYGQVTIYTSATGGRTDYGYDTLGNLTSITGPANNDAGTRPITVYVPDPFGRVQSVTDPLGHTTSYTYDNLDRVLTVTLPKPSSGSPLDFTTTYSYDNYDAPSGLLFAHITDPNGKVTKQGYDQFGRLVKSIDAQNNTTTYGYSQGLLASITDANNNVTTYGYDNARRLERTTFPDTLFERYFYTNDNLLYQTIDRKTQSITYSYDRHNRLQSKAGGGTIIYGYTGQKLTQVTDTTVTPNETHAFGFDTSYRVQSNTQATRGSITYTYNADDTVASYTVGGGGPTATHTYYPDGSLNTIDWTPVGGQFKYRYRLTGQYDTITLPNGQHRDYGYDDQGRLLQIANIHAGSGNLATYAYGYDHDWVTDTDTMLGQRTSLTATVPSQGFSGSLTKYYYDPLYQVTRADYPNVAPFNGEVHQWTYDNIGNRLTNTVNSSTQTYTYQKIGANPLNWQRLLNDGDNAYTYDPNGSAISRNGSLGSFTFGWDRENRMASVSGGIAASYKYDYQGRRSTKTMGAAVSYLYEGLNLIRESGASSADYLFGPGIDEPLAISRGGSISYYGSDGLGSVSTLNTDTGTVQNNYVYDTWGVTRSQTEAVANPFGYTGREFGEAGTLFYRARYLSPAIGRFLSEDPIQFRSGDINLFRYVGNDPVYYIDPVGLFKIPWCQIGCHLGCEAACNCLLRHAGDRSLLICVPLCTTYCDWSCGHQEGPKGPRFRPIPIPGQPPWPAPRPPEFQPLPEPGPPKPVLDYDPFKYLPPGFRPLPIGSRRY